MADIGFASDLKTALDASRQLIILSPPWEREANLCVRKHPAGCTNRRCDVGIAGHEYDAVRKIEVEEFEQLHSDRDVGFLFLAKVDGFRAEVTGHTGFFLKWPISTTTPVAFRAWM